MTEVPLLAISTQQLITTVIIVSICVIGLTNYFAQFFKRNGIKKILVFFITCSCGIVNTPLVNPMITAIVDVILLSLAVSTICRDAIVEGLPNLIKHAFNRLPEGGK